VAAIVGMFAVNLWLRHANKTKLISSVRSALFGSVADTLLLLLVSNLAIRASADINSTSEMWLIFPLVILTFVCRAKPVAGIAYSVLITRLVCVTHPCILRDGQPGNRRTANQGDILHPGGQPGRGLRRQPAQTGIGRPLATGRAQHTRRLTPYPLLTAFLLPLFILGASLVRQRIVAAQITTLF